MHHYIIEAMLKALKPVVKNPAKAQQILERFWTDKMALVWDALATVARRAAPASAGPVGYE